jgi:hypothetical protein
LASQTPRHARELEVDIVVGNTAPTPDERSSTQGAADGQVGRRVVARIDHLHGRQSLRIGVEAVASRLQQRDGKTTPLAFERQGNADRARANDADIRPFEDSPPTIIQDHRETR